MPSDSFSWSAFDDITVANLAATMGYAAAQESESARAWLSERVQRPDDEFVRMTKNVLADYWLASFAGARALVEQLIDAGVGPMGRPSTNVQYAEYVRKCRNSSSVRHVLLEALLRVGDQARDAAADEGGGFVRRISILRPEAQGENLRKAYPHQVAAWDALTATLAASRSSGVFLGLLVMPTGSGKTFTTVTWLMREVVQRGGRVLWLAHRHELLEQAAREFYAAAYLAPARGNLRIRVVSGEHSSASQIDPGDDIVIASIASLARRKDVAARLVDDPERFVVIDEAHRAPAKTYRDLIERLGRQRKRSLLGITATPTRTLERERPILSRLFGDRVIYEIGLRALIERGILSRPIPVRVDTKADVEAGVTSKDRAHLARFTELSEGWLDRIAHLEGRNAVIIGHYTANRALYGKTLVFAINVDHAALLTEAFCAQGFKAAYVASYRPDGNQSRSNREILDDFRQGDLEILINVQILTEGVDLPSIQTVFLTRPTASETLLRQMIGRALRGEAAGGTRSAYIVSFEDHWEQFRDWEGQLALIPELVEFEAAPEVPPVVVPVEPLSEQDPLLIDVLPWDLIRATAARFRAAGIAHHADAFEAVPHGWYVLDRTVDDDAVGQIIPVYAHQRPYWNELMEAVRAASTADLSDERFVARCEEIFADCDSPRPGPYAVALVLEHRRGERDVPEYVELEARRLSDPCEIARHVLAQDLGERAKAQLLAARYDALARAIYPTLRDFSAAVEDAVFEELNPDAATRMPHAVPVFDPLPSEMLGPPGAHDLDRLMAEMLETARGLLDLPGPPHVTRDVTWTRRVLKGWFARAEWQPTDAHGEGRIRVNVLLDTAEVPADVLRFILWHELLHLHLQQLHTATFRQLERRWPTFAECGRFLDTLNERFGVQYW